MRTKKEVLSNLPTELKELEEYKGWDHVEVRVGIATLETLLDIRDILSSKSSNEEKPE